MSIRRVFGHNSAIFVPNFVKKDPCTPENDIYVMSTTIGGYYALFVVLVFLVQKWALPTSGSKGSAPQNSSKKLDILGHHFSGNRLWDNKMKYFYVENISKITYTYLLEISRPRCKI